MNLTSAFSLHNVFGDHMVLQRRKPVVVSGTAAPNAPVNGFFRGANVETLSDKDGDWALEFPAGEAGGPFELTVASVGSAKIVLRDVLVGDVWICSGQSNMEFPVWDACPDSRFFRLRDGQAVAAAARDGGLRLCQVDRAVQPAAPCTDLPGRPAWRPATSPEAVGPFSAVGYWFGKTLRERLGEGVPLGLVNVSWGGTRIEPWISRKAYEAAGRVDEILSTDIALAVMRGDRKLDAVIAQRRDIALGRLGAWLRDKYFATDPAATADALANWAKPGLDTAAWTRGGRGAGRGLMKVGVTWFRREFVLPESWDGRRVTVFADTIDDCDETFLDGEKIGATLPDTPRYWEQKRRYGATVRARPGGRHVLAFRVMNHYNYGLFSGPVSIHLEGTDETVPLEGGEWLERVEFAVDQGKAGIRPPVPADFSTPYLDPQTPSTLYNAMIHPLLPLNVRGFVWYQGCSNAEAPDDYRALLRLLIDSWRRDFRDDSLPFLVTQLAAYFEHRPADRLPDDCWKGVAPGQNPGFAPLREVQGEFLDAPGCGVACTIDLGDHSDIHPANKRDVGRRLAHEALRLAYGDASALPGPRADRAVREGGAVRVFFRDAGEGLAVEGGAFHPHLFALAGAEGPDVWADACLEADGTVVVSSPDVPEPVRVEYAYGAYPPGVGFRRLGDGLPVFPFRLEVREKAAR